MAARPILLLLALAITACGGEETPSKTQEPATPEAGTDDGAPETPPEAKVPFSLNPEDLKASAENVALVPSPAEMQKSLDNAGLTTKLSTLIESRDIDTAADNTDQIAVRTGVVLAHVVLGAKEAPKDKLVAQLGKVKGGMNGLGAGTDVEATIEDISNRVANDAVNRDDLVKEMDELAGVLIPELEYEGSERQIPLIQAGAWLEGAHLVSGAIKEEGKYEAASTLLKQPQVVGYFLKYVRSEEGSQKAPDAVIVKLEETLTQLVEITSKDTLGEEDVTKIHDATGTVLGML